MEYEGLRNHVLGLLKQDTRLDGRKPLEYRQPVEIQKGYIQSASGSAYVRIGDTEVLAGVKLEVGKPYPDAPDKGSIMVGAELLPMSNPDFEPGPPSIQAIELARVVDRGIRESQALDFKKLCITAGEAAWIVIIDVCPINTDGNLFDAAALAAVAALQDTEFPTYEDGVIDYKKPSGKKLELDKVPVSVTVYKAGDKFFVDPTGEEEKAYESRLTVAFIEDGTLCAMQKGGDEGLTAEEIMQMVDIAHEKSQELRKHLA